MQVLHTVPVPSNLYGSALSTVDFDIRRVCRFMVCDCGGLQHCPMYPGRQILETLGSRFLPQLRHRFYGTGSHRDNRGRYSACSSDPNDLKLAIVKAQQGYFINGIPTWWIVYGPLSPWVPIVEC